MKTQHWSEIDEATSVLGIRILFAVYRFLGRGVFNLLLFPVISYYFCFHGAARRASRDYLRRVQARGAIPPKASIGWWSIKHFFRFGSGLLDKLAAWSGGSGLGDVRYFRCRELLEGIERGEGCVIIASHLGNMEVSRMLADSQRRVRLNILVHTRHAEKFNRILREVDENSCLNLIQVTEVSPATAVLLNEKVQAGEVVVIAGDRTPVGGGRNSEVSFLDDRALLPQGPYILAAILQCPVYLLFCLRDRRGYQVILEHFADRIRLSRKDRDAALTRWAQAFAGRLEFYALQYPMQWFNFYDFWRRSPESDCQGNEVAGKETANRQTPEVSTR